MFKLVAEIGCNHAGDIGLAKKMILEASKAQFISYVKFQKRTVRELLDAETYCKPHPDPKNSYGSTYGEHREKLEFSLAQHSQLKSECESLGVGYSSSVWDLTSARDIISLKPDYLKIPSACNQNEELLYFIYNNFKGPVHLSLGMLAQADIEILVSYIEKLNGIGRTVLYHCITGYPVSDEDLSLLEIRYLIEKYGDKTLGIGFSGHHLSLFPDMAAAALGATWIERHYTLDKTMKGTDHKLSLTPQEFIQVGQQLNALNKSLSYKSYLTLEKEITYRSKLSGKSKSVCNSLNLK